jgi:hypothetical protein
MVVLDSITTAFKVKKRPRELRESPGASLEVSVTGSGSLPA